MKLVPPPFYPPLLGFSRNVACRVSNVLATVAIALCTFSLPACDDYDDTELWNTVNDHESRLEALEQWQAEVNNNIAALQELLNTNDMITSVTPVTMGDEVVGYTISFLHSSPITIYNGTQGAQGETGETPQIGLMQGDDGNWYWTLNGELMTDADGNPIRANGEDGKDGQDGQDGEDGEDGADGSTGAPGRPGASAPTPQIKLGSSIDSGTIKTDNGSAIAAAWYLSVDNGATWYRVSGADGDAFFSKKPALSDDGSYYTFYLSDGTEIEVPAYQGITLDFVDIDITQEIAVNGCIEIVYKATGNARVTALLTCDDWTAEVTESAITVTAGKKHTECDLIVIATDNKGNSVSYTLRLGKYDYDESSKTYTVYNAAGLRAWAEAVAGNDAISCTLAADITLPTPEEGGSNWVFPPCGANGYTGTFDGAGHTISGLVINDASQSQGFIPNLCGTVKNLMIKDASINVNNKYNAGGIACNVLRDATIIGCSFSGTIKGGEYSTVGGIAGCLYSDNSIIGCYSTASVSGGDAGTIIGWRNSNTTVTACYWSGEGNSIGNDMSNEGGITKVGENDVTWQTAAEEMNKALTNTDYQWAENTGTDKDDCPLILVKKEP